MNKISICIPVYEMNGKGVKHLSCLIESIYEQSYDNYEIIISDHSKNDDIENYCKNKNKLKYFRNEKNRGSSSNNLNNAIKKSSGDIIKVMFQDDYFINKETFCNILDGFEYVGQDFKWGALSFAHVDGDSTQLYRPMIPNFIPDAIKNGNNTLGCPSVLFFKKECISELFDENLVWLMDTEYYYRLFLKFKSPFFVNVYSVAIRLWEDSVSNHMSEEIKKKELEYVLNKYKG